MKLLLVIDVADDVAKNYKALTVNYDLRGDYGEWDESIKYVEDAKPRPLSQKGNFEIADDHPFTKAEIMAYTYGITVGRNQVIDEITK